MEARSRDGSLKTWNVRAFVFFIFLARLLPSFLVVIGEIWSIKLLPSSFGSSIPLDQHRSHRSSHSVMIQEYDT